MDHSNRQRPAVLFFDLKETLLDLSPLTKRVDEVLLTEVAVTFCFTGMLQNSLVMTVSDQHASLAEIGAMTLQMLGKKYDDVISGEEAKEAVGFMRFLPVHPDVRPALAALKNMNFKSVALTNSSDDAVAAQLENAHLGDCFDRHLSVESVRRYKPHWSVYHWAADQMQEEPGNTMLVAAHGGDMAGANWARLQTAFVERPGRHLFPLGPTPNVHVPDLSALVSEVS